MRLSLVWAKAKKVPPRFVKSDQYAQHACKVWGPIILLQQLVAIDSV